MDIQGEIAHKWADILVILHARMLAKDAMEEFVYEN